MYFLKNDSMYIEMKRHSYHTFFYVLFLCFIITSLRTDIRGLSNLDIIKNVFNVYLYNFVVSIPVALTWMFGTDLYHYLKKKFKK